LTIAKSIDAGSPYAMTGVNSSNSKKKSVQPVQKTGRASPCRNAAAAT
jgi:hypothetical protein